MKTDISDVTLSQMARSFTIGNPVGTEAIETMLLMLKKQLRGTKRKFLSIYHTVSKDQGKSSTFNNEYQSIDQSTFVCN